MLFAFGDLISTRRTVAPRNLIPRACNFKLTLLLTYFGMSLSAFGAEEDSLGWGTVSSPEGGVDLVSQAIRKEKLIKYVP